LEDILGFDRSGAFALPMDIFKLIEMLKIYWGEKNQSIDQLRKTLLIHQSRNNVDDYVRLEDKDKKK
jgi:hypothetical protein